MNGDSDNNCISETDLFVNGDCTQFEIDRYEQVLEKCVQDERTGNDHFHMYNECKDSGYALYMMAESENSKDHALHLYARSCEHGYRKAMWRLLELQDPVPDIEELCISFDRMCARVSCFWGRSENGLRSASLIEESEKMAISYPVLFTCLAFNHKDDDDPEQFFHYADKAIASEEMYAAFLKARKLEELSRYKTHDRAQDMMREAIRLYGISAEKYPLSGIRLGVLTFCSQWIAQDDEKAVRMLERYECCISEHAYDHKLWTDFFKNRSFRYLDRDTTLEELCKWENADSDTIRRSGKYPAMCNISESDEWNVLLAVTISDNDFRTGILEHMNYFGGYENETFSIIPKIHYDDDMKQYPLKYSESSNLIFKPLKLSFDVDGVFDRKCNLFLCRPYVYHLLRLCIESVRSDMREMIS